LTRATLVINPKTAPYYEFYLRAAQAAASSLGIEVVFGPIGDTHAEIESAFEAFARTSNGGLILPPDTTSNIHRDLLIALAARHRLPAVYSDRFFVVVGGLMCYSADRADQYRAAARYVDRILRGAAPADLPVQVPNCHQSQDGESTWPCSIAGPARRGRRINRMRRRDVRYWPKADIRHCTAHVCFWG
jgi:putative tryptophan/tyrosine transport system substrate-binding protein